MFKSERLDATVDFLRQEKHAMVEYLAMHVYASEVIVRRSLKKLEGLGLVTCS